MAGYHNFSMSNNALEAYSNGERPLSKWTKEKMIQEIQYQEMEIEFDINLLKKLPLSELKDRLLIKTSWHHTSSHYNKTDFYSLNLDAISELTNEKLKKISEEVKKTKAAEPEKEERWICSFLEWSGSRKHPKATEITEEGIIKGNWFIRKDGSKKKTSATGFRFIKLLKTPSIEKEYQR